MVHIKVGWSKYLVWDLRVPKLKFIVNFDLLDALKVLRFLLRLLSLMAVDLFHSWTKKIKSVNPLFRPVRKQA